MRRLSNLPKWLQDALLNMLGNITEPTSASVKVGIRPAYFSLIQTSIFMDEYEMVLPVRKFRILERVPIFSLPSIFQAKVRQANRGNPKCVVFENADGFFEAIGGIAIYNGKLVSQ